MDVKQTEKEVSKFVSKDDTEKAELWDAYYGNSKFNDNQNSTFWVSEINRKVIA